MIPKIIVHNTISLDGCLVGFDIDMELYYQIAGRFDIDAVLVGSHTAEAGLSMFMDSFPEETEKDCKKPKNPSNVPPFVIPDSRGRLHGKLHAFRNSEYCGDIIVLVSKTTPQYYLKYLQDREYDMISTGRNHVNYPEAFKQLNKKYEIKSMRSDSGGVLNCILLEQQLVHEISFLFAPYIVGGKRHQFFETLKLSKTKKLALIHSEQLENEYVWCHYKIK